VSTDARTHVAAGKACGRAAIAKCLRYLRACPVSALSKLVPATAKTAALPGSRTLARPVVLASRLPSASSLVPACWRRAAAAV